MGCKVSRFKSDPIFEFKMYVLVKEKNSQPDHYFMLREKDDMTFFDCMKKEGEDKYVVYYTIKPCYEQGLIQEVISHSNDENTFELLCYSNKPQTDLHITVVRGSVEYDTCGDFDGSSIKNANKK